MKRYLFAGLLIWVPLGVTAMVINFLVGLMDQTLLLLPEQVRPDVLFGFHIPGLGVVLIAIVVLGTGVIVANLFGRKLVAWSESLLARIPLVRSIYVGVKQIMEMLLSSDGETFRKVVMIEYPRKGLWTLGFLSGVTRGEAQTKTGTDVVNVFVPTTPNPTSGFFILAPRDEVIELDMSIDDGLKVIISAGVYVPPWNPEQAAVAAAKAEAGSAA